MSQEHVDRGYRKFWPTMKEMTWKERIGHIIYYYGKYALVGAFLIYLFTGVLLDAYKEKPEVILSGTAVNVHVSVEMEKALVEEAFAFVGGEDTEKQQAALVPNRISSTDLHTGSILQTKLLSGEYHYALMDQMGLDMVLSMQALPNLYEILPEQKWEFWSDRFIFVQTEGETYPIALDITDTALAAGCTYDGDRLYLGFPVNVDTLDVIEPFLAYLQTQLLQIAP